ncbi:MAG TPA: CpsD/CapB family tyrosine-protein kinase [Pseudogracilibacillus sp.]|nr:CpsD/CapB family tyrosine-protein kinase [Pseudogracilibacillus sp.]
MLKRNKNNVKASQPRRIISKLNPRSPITEQYRTIRTNLQFSSIDEDITCIQITSAGPSAGKSITAANLAVVHAQQGKKTLLIDADMRKPTVHYTFRSDNLTGLSNTLIGETALEQATQTTDVDDLEILTCGPIPPNPSELLGSKRMQELIQHAKELYDFIIVDTPPTLAVTDAKVLANMVDGSMFVVRSGTTQFEEAEKGIKSIQNQDSKFLGAVLNDVPKDKGNSYYYYYGS